VHKKAARVRGATFVDSVALVRSPRASIGGGGAGRRRRRRRTSWRTAREKEVAVVVAFAVAVKKSHHRPRDEAISFVGLSPTLP